MAISEAEINQIAEAVAERVKEDMGIRDVIIGGAMGEGAIPLYGRELRKEPCSCCLIDPDKPSVPENRMCTTSGAIGTLKDSEEREWCSEINIVSDGRCERARKIKEAARVCKEKYPEDTTKFFECYAPAFSKITESREIKNLRQAMRDWKGEYGETPSSAEAKESFKLLKGRANAIGLSDAKFERIWTEETGS